MAELSSKLHCKKNGVTEEISVYTTLDEVQNQGINISADGVNGYVKYGDVTDDNASELNCKVNGEKYKVLKIANPFADIILLCYDIQTGVQISSVQRTVLRSEGIYLNNENAPFVSGYDFVGMEGVRHTNVKDGDTFVVYYIDQNIPDRNETTWYDISNNLETIEELLEPYYINTYSAVDMGSMFDNVLSEPYEFPTLPLFNTSNVVNMYGMFFDCSGIKSIPHIDTSNVTTMEGMFYGCTILNFVPHLYTSKVVDMSYMFYSCVSLTSIDWEIDMSSCANCDYMFENCPATNIRLKNVPSSLDLSKIGTDNYIVVDYTELEYLESTGTQYIDTGFTPDENDKMWLDFYPTKLQSACFAGCRNSGSGDRFTINTGNNNKTQYGGIGDSGNVSLGNHTVARHTASIENGLFTYDGKEVVVSSEKIGELTSKYTVYLFACNTDGATLESACRIYSCKIWNNDTLVHYYIPILDWDGIPCMYDKVTGEKLYNQGTGTFKTNLQISEVSE